ncbi:MAG: NlpC/P60 family protein [Oscillospiraceae bacterium]
MRTAKRTLFLVLALALLFSFFAIDASAAEIAFGAATVSATNLNIRSAPGTDNDIVSAIPGETIVVILEKTTDTWYKVNYKGSIGYVDCSYLKNILKAENFNAIGTIAGDDVCMRTLPSTSSSVISTYSNNTEMTVIGINNGWYKVRYSGNTGYVRSDYMDIIGSSTSISSSSSDSSTVGQQIVNCALQYVGYRYVYGSESPSVGFDCSGLVQYVYGQNGYTLTRTASQQFKYNGTEVSKSDLKSGDLVFFSSNGSSVTHVGIYIGNGQFVHASTSTTGVIVSNLYSAYYMRVYFGARRIAE